MVLLSTSEEWQRQSSLLLQARPTTTRITTKYNIPNLEAPKYQKASKRKRESEVEEKDAATATTTRIPKATLTLKTFDPESGVCLKFKTDRAADVGRLINGLGRLGRYMAALPERTEDVVMQEIPSEGLPDTAQTIPSTTTNPTTSEKAQQQPTGAGAGKKKKKGKK